MQNGVQTESTTRIRHSFFSEGENRFHPTLPSKRTVREIRIYLERVDNENPLGSRGRSCAAARRDSDRGALPGQGERRRPRTLVIVLFVTEKYNADNRE